MNRRRVTAGALLALPLVLVVLVMSGRLALVTTFGSSMEPRISAGDLVVVAPSSSYATGDVVAYRSEMFQTAVLHRVVDVEDGRHTLQGDNNSWVDPEQPEAFDLIGEEVLHVPHGGAVLDLLTHPAALAAYAFALTVAGGTATTTRRKRRRNRMSQHVTERPHRTISMSSLPPSLRRAAGVTGGAAVLATALAGFGWSGPLAVPAVAQEATNGQEMTFSYSADVPPSPAYDGTRVTSPDTVFRKLTETVDVRYAYSGRPGQVSVVAELSTAGGWRSTVPLAGPVTFEDNEYEGSVSLDLADLDARARAAAAVTGLPAEQLTVAVVPTVTSSGGETFSPELPLNLTPLTLAPAGDPASLTAGTSDGSATEQAVGPRAVDVLGLTLTAQVARALAAALAALVVLAAAVLLVLAHRCGPASETESIRRRYAALLVPVQPIPTPPGRPVVDVTDIAILAKLAERYGLLVLHWTRSGVETFVVQDEGTTYRYRTGAAPAAERVADQRETEDIENVPT